MTPAPRVARLREALWPSSGRAGWSVYAVLDCARDEAIYPAVSGCALDHACLYAGKLPDVLRAAAPHLVRLDKDAPFTQHLLEAGWGESWGVFVLSSAGLEELRRHFRRFLKVQDEDGQSLIFRWYDPRVLRVYLPTCNAGELAAVFGPAGMFVVEGEEPGTALRFHREGTGLGKEVVEV